MLINDCFDTTVKTKCLNFGHGKAGKVMESHGLLKSSKSTNPDVELLMGNNLFISYLKVIYLSMDFKKSAAERGQMHNFTVVYSTAHRRSASLHQK